VGLEPTRRQPGLGWTNERSRAVGLLKLDGLGHECNFFLYGLKWIFRFELAWPCMFA
jgi:hypothetical protein